MSNLGQAASAIGGAIIGFAVGGPGGAAWGFQIGLLAGSQLFPTQLPHVYGPRLEDLQTTQAQLGVPIPYIYGTIAVPGFVIYLGCPREVPTTTELGGKGGGTEQSQTTYTYYQTIALGLCEGPIDGLLRIWENGELKWDMRDQQDDESDEAYADRLEASGEYEAETGFALYLGDETQEADPTLEEEMGVGNVPGYRGLAYIVYPDRQLKDEQARRHPQFRFEVYKTSSGGPEVVRATNLDQDADSWQRTYIGADWANNRYYMVDLTGDEDVLRVYSILDNTEVEQKLFDDIFPQENLAFNNYIVGLDGAIYFSFFVAGNTVLLSRVDPDTLEVTHSAVYDGAAASLQATWERAVFLRQYGAQTSRDYILAGTTVSDAAVLFTAPGFILSAQADPGHDDCLVCKGAVDGTTSYGWALFWTGASSGTGPDIVLYRIKLSESFIPPGETVPVAEMSEFATISPSDIDESWTRFTFVSGLVFDETDDTLIFAVKGGASGGSGTGSGSDTLLKWDPETEEIIWQTDAGEISVLTSHESHSNHTRLRGSRYILPITGESFTQIDTRTGEITTLDFSDELSNELTDEYVYDSTLNAAIGRELIDDTGPIVIFFDRREPGRVSLAEIVTDVWQRCGGVESDIQVTDLTDKYVNGYATTRPMSGRGAIEPLRPLGPFDQVESEGLLTFPTRGKPIVVTFDESDLGAAEDSDAKAPAVICSETHEKEQPLRIRLKYMATSRDYEPGEQLSQTRFTSQAKTAKDIEIPAAISDDLAAQTAEILFAEAWTARFAYETAVDIEFLYLDPADAVALPFDGRLYRTRIIAADDAGGGLLRKLQLLRDDDGSYTSAAIADPPVRPRTQIGLYAPSGLVLLDLPPLRDEDDNAGIYGAVYPVTGGVWSGAVIQRSSDAGTTYALVASVANKATVGRLAEDLPAGITTTWDDENEIVVDLLSGSFESRTDDALLELAVNGLAIGEHGRWEIVQFQSAIQETDTRFRLRRLLRGRRATEHNTGTGVTGDLVVLLAEGIARLPLQISEINTERYYRAVTLGASVTSATPQPFTGEGEALKPFSSVNIEGERDGSNNLTISWTRRGRIGQEMPSGADIPLSEETEEYEIDILELGSPSNVVRTIESTDTEVVYTAAEQTSDGLIPGNLVTVRIYQISAVVGRGHAGEATI